jgi:hypothetical protein
MTRDILIGCLGSFLFSGGFAVALLDAAVAWCAFRGSGFVAAGLAVLVRVEDEFGEDLAGVSVDDGDVEVVDQHADVGAGQGGAELDVVQASAASEGDGARGVDGVVADAEVPVAVVVGVGFGAPGVGLGGGAPVQGAVGTAGVVVVGERVGLVLQAGQGGAWPRVQPAFEGLVEALDLALGLGVVRGAVLLGDAEGEEFDLEAVGPGV